MTHRILLGSIALEPNRWTETKTPYFRLEEMLEGIDAHGFKYVEVWQFHIDRLLPMEIASLKTEAAIRGFQFPTLALYPDLLGAESANVTMFSDMVSRCVDLGIRKIKTFSGNRASDSLSPEERAYSVSQLEALVSIAGDAGISVSAELHQNSLSDSVDAARSLLDDLHAPVGICYQPRDFSDSEKSVADLHELLPVVDHIHLQGRRDGQFSTLEDADVDYSDLLEAAVAGGYLGDFCIEFVKDCIVDRPEDFDMAKVLRNAATDRQYLSRLLEKNGA